ncbi:MAG: DUF4160 domain-containing protein [bacterium]|nr:DUF4160 domain-containing protein [Gammaproteobacteria bacterium]HIL94415.1 DUF4160 domain-containing protein [Pseudomonadales bacterium]
MTPTVFREKGYKFFFFSLEESRMHVHVRSPDGEAKLWLEPQIEIARNYRLSDVQLHEVQRIVTVHSDELITAWKKHFGDRGN